MTVKAEVEQIITKATTLEKDSDDRIIVGPFPSHNNRLSVRQRLFNAKRSMLKGIPGMSDQIKISQCSGPAGEFLLVVERKSVQSISAYISKGGKDPELIQKAEISIPKGEPLDMTSDRVKRQMQKDRRNK